MKQRRNFLSAAALLTLLRVGGVNASEAEKPSPAQESTHDMSGIPEDWKGSEKIAMLLYPGFTALDLVGPQALGGAAVAKIWSAVLGREIAYGGDDVAAFETQLASYGPTWLAYDMRLMMAGIQTFGMQSTEGTVQKLQAIVGHPLRTYENFVREAVAQA